MSGHETGLDCLFLCESLIHSEIAVTSKLKMAAVQQGLDSDVQLGRFHYNTEFSTMCKDFLGSFNEGVGQLSHTLVTLWCHMLWLV